MAPIVLADHDYAVSKSMRNRGEQCARSSTITLDTPAAAEFTVIATVSGAYTDTVVLRYDDGVLLAGCTCPYFDANSVLCKHIWAVLVECEKRRLQFPGPVDHLEIEDEFGEGSPDFDDFDFEPDFRPSRNVVPIRRAWVEPSRWHAQVASLGTFGAPPVVSRVPPEITWVLDPPSSGATLTIEITSRTPKKSGEIGQPQALRIERSAVARLASPADREILSIATASAYDYAPLDNSILRQLTPEDLDLLLS